MFERAVLIHYHEIGLKGRNRSSFERRLRDNLDVALDGLGAGAVARIASRLVVPVSDDEMLAGVLERVVRIPGISSASPVLKTSRQDHDINKAALLVLEMGAPCETFAVDARRSNTDYPRSSMDVNRSVGSYLLKHTQGKRVDLDHPDVVCHIEIVQGDAYVYSTKLRGVGGLPVGTAGKVVALLSAGIDSPVAAWRMMRRGAVVVGAHFSGRPQTAGVSEHLVAEIGHVLEESGGLARIYVVPFGDLQKEISLKTPPDLRVLLYRRLMVRIAEKIAAEERAMALVTGESLGQVASQTLDNIAAVDEAATLPVLRPLIGSDKLEIIEQARDIGTYEFSTQEHDDCCTLFMPRTPETHATVEQVVAGEAPLDLARMTDDAMDGLSWIDFGCPSYRSPLTRPSRTVG
jgi:thiamine biosynthesis protein ThiI